MRGHVNNALKTVVPLTLLRHLLSIPWRFKSRRTAAASTLHCPSWMCGSAIFHLHFISLLVPAIPPPASWWASRDVRLLARPPSPWPCSKSWVPWTACEFESCACSALDRRDEFWMVRIALSPFFPSNLYSYHFLSSSVGVGQDAYHRTNSDLTAAGLRSFKVRANSA